jgi:Bacterial Ig-like domain (group 3)
VCHVFNSTTTGITVDFDVDSTPYSVGSLAVDVDSSDATTTSLSASYSSRTLGQTVTLTAVVAAVTTGSGLPSQTVEFYDGTTDLGSGVLTVSGGYDIATLTTPPLMAGDHAFWAVYNGDGTFGQSSSDPVTVSVSAGSGGTVTLSGAASCTVGAPYVLTLPTTDSASDTITQWFLSWGEGTTDTFYASDDMSNDTHVYRSPGDYLIQAIAYTSSGVSSYGELSNAAAPSAEWTT